MDIRDAAYRALGSRNRSKKELKDYLSSKGFNTPEIEEVISSFEDAGYISDKNYAVSFFRYGFRKGWGKGRIFRELSKRGVDSVVASEAYDEYVLECEEETPDMFFDTLETEHREYERAMAVASKMCLGESFGDGISEKLKAKIARRLAGYGYEPSVIYSVINNLEKVECFDE